MSVFDNETEKHALKAFITLKRSTECISKGAHTVLGDYDLTECQFGILEAVHHLGPMSQKDLAAKILVTTANITLTVDKLEKKGLVKRERDQVDRRYYSIHLTNKGEKLIREVFPKVKELIVGGMSALTLGELQEFSRMCKALGKSGYIK